MTGAALAFDGVPGLLCPTPEAAEKLKGGQLVVSGFRVNGPIQARIRKVMAQFQPKDFEFVWSYPVLNGNKISNPMQECLLFGAMDLCIPSPARRRSRFWMDPVLCSAPIRGAETKKRSDWRNGIYSGVISPFSAVSLAGLAEVPLTLNPLYRNRAIINRALIAAFYHLVQLQGDGISGRGICGATTIP